MHLLALIALAVWIPTFLNTVLNLLFVPRLRSRAGDGDGRHVTVVIPARNEERAIERSVRSFLAQTHRDLDVVVVNDRSTDGTAAILSAIARDDARLRVVEGEPPPPGWLGKPWALHQGTRHASGDFILLVDADLRYAPGTIAAAVRELEARDLAMVTLLPDMELRGFWEHVALPMLAFAFFVMLPSWLANRTRTPRLALGGGTGMLMRRSVYESFGGHQPLKDAVVDDIGLARVTREHGGRTMAFRADHLVSIRMYHGGKEILDGFTKNVFTAMAKSYAIVAFWLAVGLVGNILPYVLAATGDRAAIATVVLISATRLLVFVPLGYGVVNALVAHPLMMSFWAFVMLRSAWFTGVRGQVHWRGRSYTSST
jgi:glycosyltransferase involved in cell wall biosynthesis